MTPFERMCAAKRGDFQLRIEQARAALDTVPKHSRRADGQRATIALCKDLLAVIERYENAPWLEYRK